MALEYHKPDNAAVDRRYLPQGRTYRVDFSHTSKGASKQGFELLGSATATIIVTRIRIAKPGTAMTFKVDLTSAATTGGAGSTLTPTPMDQNYAASTATAKTYQTTAPTGGGTSRGVLMAAESVGTSEVVELVFNENGAAGPVLRGTASGLTVTHGTDNIAYKGFVEFIEKYDEGN